MKRSSISPSSFSLHSDNFPSDLISQTGELRDVAMQGLFDHLNDICEGALIVDERARIVWISPKYARMIQITKVEDALGRPVEDVLPNSLMRQVVRSGEPIMLDIMQFGKESFVVTRLPVRLPSGKVAGAIGFVLYNRLQYLKPIVAKFAQIQEDLMGIKKSTSQNRRAKYTFDQIVSQAPASQEMLRLAKRAANLESTVLLLGETGTGKELLAHAIHNHSPRASKPFVSVNAAAIPEALMEAEFFGTAPGAYTGADKRGRVGKFKLADGGTLFLDEVGDMPLSLQVKLLRVLQEHEIEPLGSNQIQQIDVRVIAATSLDLEALVEQGRFRPDLYYRLNVLSIPLPPLRERRMDLSGLCGELLTLIAERTGLPKRTVTAGGMSVLSSYPWPGNVRELRNALERAVMISDKLKLDTGDIHRVISWQNVKPGTLDGNQDDRPGVLPLERVVATAERLAIENALSSTNGNKVEAARLLGISRATLYHKLAN